MRGGIEEVPLCFYLWSCGIIPSRPGAEFAKSAK